MTSIMSRERAPAEPCQNRGEAPVVAVAIPLLVILLNVLFAAMTASAQGNGPLAFDDRCTPAQWKCREASIRRNQATTHPLLRETLPALVETLGLDPGKRFRNIDLVDPKFASAFYELVRRYPDVLPLWDKKDAEHNVRSLIARCKPMGDENACYLADLKYRLRQRLDTLQGR